MNLGIALVEFAAAQLLEAAVAEVGSRAVRRVVGNVVGDRPTGPGHQYSRRAASRWASSVRSHVPGRVRLSVPAVRGEPRAADAVEARLGRLAGVRRVSATPMTGSILVEYDPARVTLGGIRAALEPRRRRLSRACPPRGRQLSLVVES
jgi:copper chaperone CopZ